MPRATRQPGSPAIADGDQSFPNHCFLETPVGLNSVPVPFLARSLAFLICLPSKGFTSSFFPPTLLPLRTISPRWARRRLGAPCTLYLPPRRTERKFPTIRKKLETDRFLVFSLFHLCSGHRFCKQSLIVFCGKQNFICKPVPVFSCDTFLTIFSASVGVAVLSSCYAASHRNLV